MTRIIDLRSDTVTQPTERMRDAMRAALVGDNVLGEDPTVSKLESLSAEMFHKEAALFVASGTMANQVAVLTLCNHGDQIVVQDRSHIFNLEVGGLAGTCAVQPRAIPAQFGVYDLIQLEQQIQLADIQRSPTTLICMENTFDLNRGLVVNPEHILEVTQLANKHGIKTFLDGARLFNAAIALDLPVHLFCEGVNVVATCLSKGLGCPIGSLLMGTEDFITRARRMRQRIGGGWRQAGILAAAGIVALEEMVDRIAEDHINARRLAEGLLDLGLGIDLSQVQTNIIFCNLSPLRITSEIFCSYLTEFGVKAKAIGQFEIRMVTHKDVSSQDIAVVLEKTMDCLKKIKDIP